MIFTALAVVAALIVPAAPPPAFCHNVAARINVVRAHHGLSPMNHSPALRAAALNWARTDPTTHGHWIARIRAEGVTDPNLGEIIAWGYSTPRAVVRAWMLSPPHRRVVLASNSFLQNDGAGCHFGGSREFVVVDFSGQ